MQAEVVAGANTLAELLESLGSTEWMRTGIYNWPEPGPRTVEWIGVHTVHEVEHHAGDIDRLLR